MRTSGLVRAARTASPAVRNGKDWLVIVATAGPAVAAARAGDTVRTGDKGWAVVARLPTEGKQMINKLTRVV